MTDTATLIAKAKTELESREGHHYSPGTLAETIEAGLEAIPAGTVIMRGSDNRLVWQGDRFAVVSEADDSIIQTLDVTPQYRDAALVEYAKRMAQRAVGRLA